MATSSVNALHGPSTPEQAEKELEKFFQMEQTVALIKPGLTPEQKSQFSSLHSLILIEILLLKFHFKRGNREENWRVRIYYFIKKIWKVNWGYRARNVQKCERQASFQRFSWFDDQVKIKIFLNLFLFNLNTFYFMTAVKQRFWFCREKTRFKAGVK